MAAARRNLPIDSMPLLVYCIADDASGGEPAGVGVHGAAVGSVSESGLSIFVSEYRPGADNSARSTVLEFQRVLETLLGRMAILPFRFPTVMGDESEVREFLREHAEGYKKALIQLRDLVQMEVHLRAGESKGEKARSGTEYLRAKQARRRELAGAALAIRKSVGAQVRNWREHESEDGTRCYALVAKSAVADFLERIKRAEISPRCQARVTGPWPATEFIDVPQSATKGTS
jgi:Gas vesicle synthesis protein GvpL/GvpF